MNKLSPFQYHRLNPRARMAAALNGLAGFADGVQVRENEAATALVPAGQRKSLVESTLMAPVVGSGLIPSRVQLTPATEQLDLRNRSILNPPRYDIMQDPRRYNSDVHRFNGFAGLGLVMRDEADRTGPRGGGETTRTGSTGSSGGGSTKSTLDAKRAAVFNMEAVKARAAALANRRQTETANVDLAALQAEEARLVAAIAKVETAIKAVGKRGSEEKREELLAELESLKKQLVAIRARIAQVKAAKAAVEARGGGDVKPPTTSFPPVGPRPMVGGPKLVLNRDVPSVGGGSTPTGGSTTTGGGSTGSGGGTSVNDDPVQLIDGGPVPAPHIVADKPASSMPSWLPWAAGGALVVGYFLWKRG